MKLLHCYVCYDLIGVTPILRKCFCGRSQAIYDIVTQKEVYSGPAILLGVKDEELIHLNDNLDENFFYKGTWVTISPIASTVLKVKDASKWKPKKVERGLTRPRSRRYNANSGPR